MPNDGKNDVVFGRRRRLGMEPSTSPEGTDEVESLLTLLWLPLELWPPEETDESGFKCSAIVVEEEEKSNMGIKIEWQC